MEMEKERKGKEADEWKEVKMKVKMMMIFLKMGWR